MLSVKKYPAEYAHVCAVLCFPWVELIVLASSCDYFSHIPQGCLQGTGANRMIVRIVISEDMDKVVLRKLSNSRLTSICCFIKPRISTLCEPVCHTFFLWFLPYGKVTLWLYALQCVLYVACRLTCDMISPVGHTDLWIGSRSGFSQCDISGV